MGDIDKDKEKYKSRAADYLATFTSDAGKRVLKDLRASYCGDLVGKDNDETNRNIGKRQVIKDIEAVLLLGKRPDVIDSLFVNPEDDEFQF